MKGSSGSSGLPRHSTARVAQVFSALGPGVVSGAVAREIAAPLNSVSAGLGLGADLRRGRDSAPGLDKA